LTEDRTLSVTIDVAVPAERAWAALVDWPSQGEWMLGTSVRGTEQDGRGVGGGVSAWTGIRLGRIRLGFLDTMVITVWEPPHRCLVDHTGRVVRGTGGFEIAELGAAGCRVHWFERVEVPFGAVGRLGWAMAMRPAARWGVVRSLRRFRRMLETG
jgi:carbon monoxide dehydrogenase subunit G